MSQHWTCQTSVKKLYGLRMQTTAEHGFSALKANHHVSSLVKSKCTAHLIHEGLVQNRCSRNYINYEQYFFVLKVKVTIFHNRNFSYILGSSFKYTMKRKLATHKTCLRYLICKGGH